ncbi:MAG: DUF402 domain-containing protein [Gemmatimonadota bacterium]
MIPGDPSAGPPHPIRPLRIHYLRPPNRLTVFRQLLLRDSPEVLISFAPSTSLPRPVEVEGGVILEDGSPVVWFTFPGTWHDIGRFHRADGTFTGIYANVLTPPRLRGEVWSTVDLFLDVWLPSPLEEARRQEGNPGGAPTTAAVLLDRQELEEAHSQGWISPRLYTRAWMEARRLLTAVEEATWPPPVVGAWPLERCEALMR